MTLSHVFTIFQRLAEEVSPTGPAAPWCCGHNCGHSLWIGSRDLLLPMLGYGTTGHAANPTRSAPVETWSGDNWSGRFRVIFEVRFMRGWPRGRWSEDVLLGGDDCSLADPSLLLDAQGPASLEDWGRFRHQDPPEEISLLMEEHSSYWESTKKIIWMIWTNHGSSDSHKEFSWLVFTKQVFCWDILWDYLLT